MLKVDLYSTKGAKTGTLSLPKDFDTEINLSLLAQAVRVYEDRSHPGLAKVKTRSEVSRTKKKWYRQKGTGGARHGSKSAPIFVGGGVAHGPKGVKRELTLSKNLRNRAFRVALALKAKNKEIAAVSGIDRFKKASEAENFLKILTKTKEKKNQKYTLVLSAANLGTAKTFRNLKNVEIKTISDLNARKVYYAGMLIFDRNIFETKRK